MPYNAQLTGDSTTDGHWINGRKVTDNIIAVAGTDGNGNFYIPDVDTAGNFKTRNLVWDPGSLAWVAETQPSGGGGGGTVTANQGTAGTSMWKVDGSGVTQPVSGSVGINNWPSTQQVSGTVGVNNFPSVQTVSVNNWPATQTVSGSVTVNTISNYALETGGNLAALVANTTAIDTDIKASQPRKLQDGSGTAITSQSSGTQRALDVGVNVGGVQVDPRSIRPLTAQDSVSVANAIIVQGVDDSLLSSPKTPVIDHMGNLQVSGDDIKEILNTLKGIERILMAMHLTASQSYSGSFIDPNNDVKDFIN